MGESERERATNPDQDVEGLCVEERSDGSVAYELLASYEGTFRVPLGPERTVDIEIPPNPPIRVMDGREFSQLDAPFVLVQFEVVAQDWRRGWFPLGGDHYDSELEFGEPESTLVFEQPDGGVCVWGDGPYDLEMERTGTFPLYVVVRERVNH